MRSSSRVIAAAFLCLVAATQARAQVDSDAEESGRFRRGALSFTPSVAVSNIGVDNNVFNDPANPKKDNTATVGPAVKLWLRMGRSRLSGQLAGQYQYFQEYETQRGWNEDYSGRWEIPTGRFTPFIAGSYRNSRDRSGYEIDSRVRLKDESAGLGTRVDLFGKTAIDVAARRVFTRYDDQDAVLGGLAAIRLNRQTDYESLNLRYRVTPLTTVVLRSEASQDRFDYEPIKDADNFIVMPGLEVRPQAVISGEAFVGVRRFDAIDAAIPDYTGLVAKVGTKYILRATEFDLTVARDNYYSLELLQPYYTQTEYGLLVIQRIGTKWDLIGRGAQQNLAYHNVQALASASARVDHNWQAGGGVRYLIGETLRVGFDANYYRRESPTLLTRNYDGLRMGFSFSYGLTQ